jgi:hypothetical protein
MQVPDDLFVLREQLVRIGHGTRMTHDSGRWSHPRTVS